MKSQEFVSYRKKLKKTQVQLAQLLGVSLKAVRSYEQGWRSVPAYVEKQMLLLIIRFQKKNKQQLCWTTNKCPDEKKEQCPAWEFQAGELCWFINGTICDGVAHKKWEDKFKNCKKCDVMASLL